jgi:hypothetical protein
MATLFKTTGSEANGYIVFPDKTGKFIKVLFQHIPEGLSDGRKANYEVKEIAKRTEPLLIYQATGFREISFSLRFGARSIEEAYELYAFCNLLRRSVFPTNSGIPNTCKLHLGQFFVYYDVVDSGDGVTMQNSSDFSEAQNGMDCVVRDYQITPSEKRLNPDNNDVSGLPQTPSNWWVKVPSEITVSLSIYVFLGTVWGQGCLEASPSHANPDTLGAKETQGTGATSNTQGGDPVGNSATVDPAIAGDGTRDLGKPPGTIKSRSPGVADANGTYRTTTVYQDEKGNVTGQRVVANLKEGGRTVTTTNTALGLQSVTTFPKGGMTKGVTVTSPLPSEEPPTSGTGEGNSWGGS